MEGPRVAGAAACGNCPHPRATHEPGDPYKCRLNGCPCPGFADQQATSQAEQRTVTFTIPEGYGFTVSFWPLKEDAEADD